jgi:two-component system OmpR family response regulator
VRESRLLVVEGDPDRREWLARGLEHAGFEAQRAESAVAALAQLATPPDALVIDAELPDANGHDLCAALRAQGVSAPALFLIRRDAASGPPQDFGTTADDYVFEPVEIHEVVARVRGLLRSSRGSVSVAVGTVRLDPVMHALTGESGAVSLTPTEFRVLSALAERRGAVVRRQEIIRAAWPEGAIVHDNTLDQYIRRLRSKLRKVTDGTGIVTTRRVGYRLE